MSSIKPKTPKPSQSETELQRSQRSELDELTRDKNARLKALRRNLGGMRSLLGSGGLSGTGGGGGKGGGGGGAGGGGGGGAGAGRGGLTGGAGGGGLTNISIGPLFGHQWH